MFSSAKYHVGRPARRGPSVRRIVAISFTLTACGGMARAQQANASIDIDRAFDFVDQTAAATAVFNENRPAEALALFQQIAAVYSDLDTDGHVAISIGDCLVALDRNDEAWSAYEAALAVHPELETTIRRRLDALELTTGVSDELLNRLRSEAFVETPEGFAASWRLGRGLQRRAADLLNEAILAFDFAAEHDAPFLGRRFLQTYSGTLEGISDDLDALIEQMNRRTSGFLAIGQVGAFPCGRVEIGDEFMTVERSDVQWAGTTEAGQRFEYRIELDEPTSGVQITVNGRPIELASAQRQLIEHYQQRIGTILHEAAKSSDAPRAER